MEKVELKIVGLSYSQGQTGSYILVLGEIEGNLKLPIIIKPSDAQFIALKMEDIKTPRPQIQDLVKSITDNLDVDLQQIYISNILEGIFYSKLIFDNHLDDSFEIDCTIGDAICLSLLYKCPILCSQEVLKLSGVEVDDDGVVENEKQDNTPSSATGVTVDDLKIMLDKALENEEYEIASQLRDRITELSVK
jgi:bifunctional DNase/RNase